jgi:hypothetical protein
MIAAEGLATVGRMIAAYRRGDSAATDYEIGWVTVELRDLRVRDETWARMDPAHQDAHRRLWIDVVRRAQPGHVAAPAALLALASSRQQQVVARRDTYHLSTRLRCSPFAMTQAGRGRCALLQARLIRSSNRRSDRHVARVFAEPMGVDLIGYADHNPVSRS